MPPNVLFINPPSIPYNHLVLTLEDKQTNLTNFLRQPIAMPMGILYLSAVLERDFDGIDIRILDYAKLLRESGIQAVRPFHDVTTFIEHFLATSIPPDYIPDMIGLSILFSTAHKTAGLIADAMKRRWPNVPIVVGGMHSTNAVPTLLEMPSIDYVCRGEGESLVSDLLRRCLQGAEKDALPGIYSRAKLAASGGACLESAELIDDLDTIPFPAWHLIPMDEYVHSVGSRVRRIDEIQHDREATIVTTRGCPFSCTFCSSWTVHGRRMRFRSVANVIAELDLLQERYGVNMVVPEDDLFTVKKTRIVELCNAIADRFGGTMHFQFPNGLSVATLDRDVIDAMVRMGMTLANVAIESGSAYVQKHIIKKNCDLDRARRVVQDCRDAGIQVRTYFVIGFPGETTEFIEETFAFAASLASDWNNFHIAAPLIGTEMYQQMLDRGDIDATFNWDEAFFMERMFDTAEVTADELKRLVYSANMRINFFGNYNLQTGDYERAIKMYREVLNGHPGHLGAQYCIGLAYRAMGDEEAFRQAIDSCRRQLETSGMAREHLQLLPELFPELSAFALI